MKCYAFIFARGGSQGLPRKNVRPLGGIPLIVHSINSALSVPEIEKVFVSTEDQEIKLIAETAGALVIDRPKALASNEASEFDAWKHAVEWVSGKFGDFDDFVSLPPTSPLRSAEDINKAIFKRREMGADLCISITESHRSPFFNMIKCDANGRVSLVCDSGATISRRQDVPRVYDITTVVYACAPVYIVKANSLLEGDVVAVEVAKERAVDIDDIFDFKFAEVLMEERFHAKK